MKTAEELKAIVRDKYSQIAERTIAVNKASCCGSGDVSKEVFAVAQPGLLAVLDKRSHAHPPDLFYIYKIFIYCIEKGGEIRPGIETSEVAFYGPDELPPLSTTRITTEQIQMLFEFKNNPGKKAVCD